MKRSRLDIPRPMLARARSRATLRCAAGLAALLAGAALAGCARAPASQAPMPASTGMNATGDSGQHFVQATTPEAAGEYLTIVGGCNDCHTPNWAEKNGNVPPDDRLTGSPVGYRGPWGTSYAVNLRMVASQIAEDRWVQILTTAAGGRGRPPMPWMNLERTSDRDLRAIYRYIKGLGPKGTGMPRAVPPGQEPTTPYILFTPQAPKP